MALALGALLVVISPTLRASVAVGVYALSLTVLFTVSAVYHRVQWSPRARAAMRRADHASIFILIAGSYTPISLLGVGGAAGTRLCIAVWCGAFVGVMQSLFWAGAPKWVQALLAVGVGWMVVPYLGDVRRTIQAEQIWLMLAGGIAYTLGAVVYATKKPDPRPRVFGYHEVFHALTIVGAALHFVAVLQIVRRLGS